MEHLADEALVDRVRQGDKDAYRMLIDRHKAGVYSLIRCRVDSRETAEDLAQEVFLKLYRTLGSFRGDSRFATWLYRIAYNTLTDHLRSARRRPVQSVMDTVKGWFVDPAPQPEAAAIAQEERDTLIRLLRLLPEKYREALFLYHYRQLTASEIALLLALPVKTVETRLSRGKQLLKQRWLEVHEHEIPPIRQAEAPAWSDV